MRKLILIVLKAILFSSCSCAQQQNIVINLSATEFAEKIKQLPAAAIIDVRTPDEFSKGHLVNANNYDWNNDGFEKKIALLDKSKPVFVYCLSGGRSSSAASKMRENGFKTVYELSGGILKWRGANLPQTTENMVSAKGITKQQFIVLLESDRLVLIDFYADWCAPCKQMKPYLDEISKDMADKVVLIRIDADNNQALCKALKIDALPVLQLYKNKKLLWSNAGFIEKAGVIKQLNKVIFL